MKLDLSILINFINQAIPVLIILAKANVQAKSPVKGRAPYMNKAALARYFDNDDVAGDMARDRAVAIEKWRQDVTHELDTRAKKHRIQQEKDLFESFIQAKIQEKRRQDAFAHKIAFAADLAEAQRTARFMAKVYHVK